MPLEAPILKHWGSSSSKATLCQTAICQTAICPEEGFAQLASYPESELYRLIVDGYLLEKDFPSGRESYERRETGCINAMFKAMEFAFDPSNWHHDIVGFCHKVHELVTKNVRIDFLNHLAADRSLSDLQGNFRTLQMTWHIYGVEYPWASIDSIASLISDIIDVRLTYLSGPFRVKNSKLPAKRNGFITQKQILTQEQINYLAAEIHNNLQAGYIYRLTYKQLTSAEHAKQLHKYFQSYRNAISCANTKDKKLMALVKLGRSCMTLHPYYDANSRCFINILLNTLLLQLGYPPATFHQPIVFSLGTEQECLQEIKSSLQTSHNLISASKRHNNSNLIQLDEKEIINVNHLAATLTNYSGSRAKL